MKKYKRFRFHTTTAIIMLIAAGTVFAIGVTNTGNPSSGYTSSDVLLLLIYILLALVFSFLCSVAEAVLLSITPSYIAGLREKRPKQAALLKRLKQDNVDRSLAAILTLNTIAHTVGAIGSGSKAAIIFGSTWFGMFSAIMTLLILFLSEIIPKTLGAVHWRKLTGMTALFVRGLIVVMYPLIMISQRLTRLIAHGNEVHVFSRDEFLALTAIGEQSGHINEDESRIIRNLFRFRSLKAGDIMTPRTVVVALQQDITVSEALKTIAKSPFSRLPLYRTNLDDITGIILKDDMLLNEAKDKGNIKLKKLGKDITFVNETMPLSDLLEFMLDKRQHIALVVDEYGGTEGLVTLEDVVETLLGMEIVDEADGIDDLQNLARRQWAKRAKALGLELEK